MRLSSARRSFFRLKARAISRVPTLPGCSPMKARSSSLDGKAECFLGLFEPMRISLRAQGALSLKFKERMRGFASASRRLRCWLGYLSALPEDAFGPVLSTSWRSWRCLPRRASCGLAAAPSARRPSWRPARSRAGRLRRASSRRRASARASSRPTASSSVIGLRRLVARQVGVDAVVADVGPVAAVLDDDRAALLRMVAERACRGRRRSGGPCRGWPSSLRSA